MPEVQELEARYGVDDAAAALALALTAQAAKYGALPFTVVRCMCRRQVLADTR